MVMGRLPEFATEITHGPTMRRFPSLVLIAWCLIAGAATGWAAKPNVLVVMTDDQGWGELPIRRASQFISDYHHMPIGEKLPYGFEGLTKTVKPGDTAAVFTVELEKGPVALHTWFQGKGTMLSAYYVYVTRN